LLSPFTLFGLFAKKKRTTMKVVDECDFVAFLKELGVFEALETREARCAVCGTALVVDDVDAVYPLDGEVKLLCGNPKCILNRSRNEDYD
jgi:hypothetical protein